MKTRVFQTDGGRKEGAIPKRKNKKQKTKSNPKNS
jgi:hypothetical protein